MLAAKGTRRASWSKVKLLGQGAFGKVYLVKNAKGENCVLKEVSMQGMDRPAMKEAYNEITNLRKVSAGHRNIIGYREHWVKRESSCLCILLEHAAGGDLHALIQERRKRRDRFSEAEVHRLLTQIADGMSYCHDTLKLIHRDLKPANIFLDRYGNVKIGDFGLSKLVTYTVQILRTQAGTPLYMAPEMIDGISYTFAADVFAMGCILFELITFSPPWMMKEGNTITAIFRNILTGNVDPQFKLRDHPYSEELIALLHWLLHKQPTQRPTMSRVRDMFVLPLAPAAPNTPKGPCDSDEGSGSFDSYVPYEPAAAVPLEQAAVAAHLIQRSFRRVPRKRAPAGRDAGKVVVPSVARPTHQARPKMADAAMAVEDGGDRELKAAPPASRRPTPSPRGAVQPLKPAPSPRGAVQPRKPTPSPRGAVQPLKPAPSPRGARGASPAPPQPRKLAVGKTNLKGMAPVIGRPVAFEPPMKIHKLPLDAASVIQRSYRKSRNRGVLQRPKDAPSPLPAPQAWEKNAAILEKIRAAACEPPCDPLSLSDTVVLEEEVENKAAACREPPVPFRLIRVPTGEKRLDRLAKPRGTPPVRLLRVPGASAAPKKAWM